MSLRFGFRQRSIFYPRSFTMFPIPTTFGFLLLLWFATTRRESPQDHLKAWRIGKDLLAVAATPFGRLSQTTRHFQPPLREATLWA